MKADPSSADSAEEEIAALKAQLAAARAEIAPLAAALASLGASRVLERTGFRTLDELSRNMERAFALACFVLGDDGLAARATRDTFRGLCHRLRLDERRRGYRKLFEKTDRTPTKVPLAAAQHCQALLLNECTRYERCQERELEVVATEDLVLRYVKHLVEVAFDRQLVVLNVAISRILYGFDKESAWRIQKRLEHGDRPSPRELYRDDPLSRPLVDRKTELERQLAKRFDRYLKSVDLTGHVTVTRPMTPAERERFDHLIRSTLRQLVFWDATACTSEPVHPELFDRAAFRPASHSLGEALRVDLARKGALICPDCYRQLVASVRLDLTRTPLQMPDFNIHTRGAGQSDPGDPQPPVGGRPCESRLGEERSRSILVDLLVDETRRSRPAAALSIAVHGESPVHWDLATSQGLEIQLDPLARWLSIAAETPCGSVPLASILLSGLQLGSRHLLPSVGSIQLTVQLDRATGRAGGLVARFKQRGQPAEGAGAHGQRRSRWWRALGLPELLGGWRWVAAAAAATAIVVVVLGPPRPGAVPPTAAVDLVTRLLMPESSGERAAPALPVLTIPPRARHLVLVVPLPSTSPDIDLRVELHTPGGVEQLVGHAIDDELSISLPVEGLVAGSYRLLVRGAGADSEIEVPFEVRFDG